MTYESMDAILKNLKEFGKQLFGEDVKPTYAPKKPRHVPKPGRTWSAYVREKNLERKNEI